MKLSISKDISSLANFLFKKKKLKKELWMDYYSFGLYLSGVLISIKSFAIEEVYVSFISLPTVQKAHVPENTWEEYHVSVRIMRTYLSVLYLLEYFSFDEKFLDFWIMTDLIHLNSQGKATYVLNVGQKMTPIFLFYF